MAFLVYDQGVESPVAIWDREPLPEELAEGQVAWGWFIVDSDFDHSHYLLRNGVIEHVVPEIPQPPAPPPEPNIEQMCVDIMQDSSLYPAGFQMIKDFKLLLKDYLSQGDYGQQWIFTVWQQYIKPQLDATNPLLAPAVIGHAVANNIHLAPPEEESSLLAALHPIQ